MNIIQCRICKTFLIVAIGLAVGALHQQMLSKVVDEFDRKIIRKSARLEIKGESLIFCHYRCLIDEECMSFFYDNELATCRVHGVVFFNPDDGELSTGSRYYRPFQVSDLCPTALGYVYNRALAFCYKIHYLSPGSYSHARQVCQGEGGDLVIADTEQKLFHLGQTLGASTFPANYYRGFLIGATDEVEEGIWRWLDGQQSDGNSWCPNEPNNEVGNENYVIIDFLNELPGCMNDVPGHLGFHFICELKLKT